MEIKQLKYKSENGLLVAYNRAFRYTINIGDLSNIDVHITSLPITFTSCIEDTENFYNIAGITAAKEICKQHNKKAHSNIIRKHTKQKCPGFAQWI